MASRDLFLLSLLAFTVGYSFDLVAPPTQCGPLSLKINGGSGKPPYTALVVPYDANPIPRQPEMRNVLSKKFSDDSARFTLPYPANSSFVIMLGDTKGINTGGTSVPTTVGTSKDQSCFPNTVSAQFSFQILPSTAINQCTPATLAWNSSAQDPVSISLIIPGDHSRNIPNKNVGPQQGKFTGFSWTPNIPAGTNIILVANDRRGAGIGGSVNVVVGNNPQSDSSCLSRRFPRSTAGTPGGGGSGDGNGNGVGKGTGTGKNAGAGKTTGAGKTSGAGKGTGAGKGGGGTNTGAIVGGVIGGVAALLGAALAAWFLIRRHKQRQNPAVYGVDLLITSTLRIPVRPAESHTPVPYIVLPSQSRVGVDETGRPGTSSVGGKQHSVPSTGPDSEHWGVGGGVGGSSSNVPSSRRRKGPANAPQSRPVDIVQHEDAGEVEIDGGSAGETIELPPRYMSMRR